jgi:hypothetical protein
MPTLLEKASAALSETLERLTHLRVITVLGDARITGPIGQLKVELPAPPSQGAGQAAVSMVTDVHLVAGDVTNVLSPAVLDPGHAALRALHEESVRQAQAIVEGNLRSLTQLLGSAAETLRGLDAPPAPPPGG